MSLNFKGCWESIRWLWQYAYTYCVVHPPGISWLLYIRTSFKNTLTVWTLQLNKKLHGYGLLLSAPFCIWVFINSKFTSCSYSTSSIECPSLKDHATCHMTCDNERGWSSQIQCLPTLFLHSKSDITFTIIFRFSDNIFDLYLSHVKNRMHEIYRTFQIFNFTVKNKN
jgi:hypothetical protein